MAFFVIAYLISWAAWITLFARHLSHLVGLGMWLYLLAVLAPHASVVFNTAMEAGSAGVRGFLPDCHPARATSRVRCYDLHTTNCVSGP